MYSCKEYVQMYLKSANTDARSSESDFVHKKFGEHWKICIAPSVEGHFQQIREMTDNT